MIDADFVTTIIESAAPRVLKIGEKEYSTAALVNPPLPTEPAFPTIALQSLDSLTEYIKANKDGLKLDGAVVLAGHAQAKLVGPPSGENRKRDEYVIAYSGAETISFGNYLCLEDFRDSIG